jgi:hypothetical protein
MSPPVERLYCVILSGAKINVSSLRFPSAQDVMLKFFAPNKRGVDPPQKKINPKREFFMIVTVSFLSCTIEENAF